MSIHWKTNIVKIEILPKVIYRSINMGTLHWKTRTKIKKKEPPMVSHHNYREKNEEPLLWSARPHDKLLTTSSVCFHLIASVDKTRWNQRFRLCIWRLLHKKNGPDFPLSPQNNSRTNRVKFQVNSNQLLLLSAASGTISVQCTAFPLLPGSKQSLRISCQGCCRRVPPSPDNYTRNGCSWPDWLLSTWPICLNFPNRIRHTVALEDVSKWSNYVWGSE